MQTFVRGTLAAGLLAIGYVIGVTGILAPTVSQAQKFGDKDAEVALDNIKAAAAAVEQAMHVLSENELYNPAITGINAFAVTAGGLNALQDLESGRGVDPETFAGLYAGLAVDEIMEHLGKDEEGRLTYKNKVIRMYPVSRLKRMFEHRSKLIGAESEE